MRPEDFEHFRRIAQDLEKHRPSPEQWEGMRRQAELAKELQPSPELMDWASRRSTFARELLSDPNIWQSYSDTSRIFEQLNAALPQTPDQATWKAVAEAAQYFDSGAFLRQRDSVLQAAQLAQQRLGTEGLAAAWRVAARHSTKSEYQERATELIRAGQTTELLEEATQLAASPEVRETIELADTEALLRLDEEQQAEDPAAEPGAAEPEVYEDEFPEFTKEQLIELHDQALLHLWPLQVTFVVLTLTTPGAPILATLGYTVTGLLALVSWSKIMISRWED